MAVRAADLQGRLDEQCAGIGIDRLRTPGAQCVFVHLRQVTGGVPALGIPPWCEEEAPERINAYSDGSWVNARCAYLALGGSGVWWPERPPLERLPNGCEFIYIEDIASPSEVALADFGQADVDGIRLGVSIRG